MRSILGSKPLFYIILPLRSLIIQLTLLILRSSLYMALAGNSTDWLTRRTEDSITVAVLFVGSNGTAAAMALDEGHAFAGSLSSSLINGWVGQKSSMFKLAEK